MNILFCGLTERLRALAKRALTGGNHRFSTAANVSEALSSICMPAIVLVGGSTNLAVVESCRRLRSAMACRHALIVAFIDQPIHTRALLDAGADDFVVESEGEELLRSRLLVVQRTAKSTTQRRSAEHDLECFFQLSVELLSTAGLDGYFKKVNPAWTKALGWSDKELLSRPSIDFVHVDDREATLAARDLLRTGQSLVSFTNRYMCKGGGYRWFEWQVGPLVSEGVIYAVTRDTTEDRAAKEALEELSESLATTLDSIGDGVIATDLTGAVVRMNGVAEQLTGWTLSEASGQSLHEVLALVDRSVSGGRSNVFVAPSAGGGAHLNGVMPSRTHLRRRNGSEIPISDSCAPIKSGGGKVSGAVLVFRDLTHQVEAEEAQAKLQRQLVFADRMTSIGTLAAGAAHEINNPLSYVVANLDLAIEEGVDASEPSSELAKMLFAARDGAARVTKIVRGLKTFSQVEQEQTRVIELGPVIELSIGMALNEIRHRARLVMDFGDTPLVDADDGRLGQVFLNLLVNAAQAFPDGNTEANEIRVVTSTNSEGNAVVEVRDTGSGIAPELLDRIFDPFFTTKAVGVGTGLGLAISRNIVTAMGGELSVHSVLGHGTTFKVTILRSSGVEVLTQPMESCVVPRGGRSGSVLVIDDEPAVGEAIQRILRDHVVTVVTAGQAALALLAANENFDVVLSDLMMPGMSGMELHETLVRLHPRIAPRVVFLSGGAFTAEANAFLARIDNERMEKPFDANTLRAVIRRLVA